MKVHWHEIFTAGTLAFYSFNLFWLSRLTSRRYLFDPFCIRCVWLWQFAVPLEKLLLSFNDLRTEFQWLSFHGLGKLVFVLMLLFVKRSPKEGSLEKNSPEKGPLEKKSPGKKNCLTSLGRFSGHSFNRDCLFGDFFTGHFLPETSFPGTFLHRNLFSREPIFREFFSRGPFFDLFPCSVLRASNLI